MAILDQFGMPYTFAHAAERNPKRGPQYHVRTDDIDKLIPSRDRKTIASLSNRMFMNMGIPRACILQKADYVVGEAWLPTYLGPDREQGKPVARMLQELWYPQCDTRGGVYDWWKLLELSSMAIDRDGDCFWMMVRGSDGMPRIQLIPSHRCSSGFDEIVEKGDFAGYRIRDGVIYFKSGRPAGYRFLVGETVSTENYIDVPASDVIHLFDPTHCEQGRGLPAFTHALESLKMSLLSTEDERIRQQIVSRLHLTVFNDTGGPDLDDVAGTLEGINTGAPSAFSTKEFPGGTIYLPAEGNQRVEQMRHENPGIVWESFQDRLARDAVVPVWSYSVWKSTGQGTAERGEILKCRRFVTKRQGQLWYAAKRAISWAYSVFAEQGRVPVLQRPTAWDFSRPPRLSVDDGRESKMELDELVTGSRNLSEVLEARGINEEDFLMQRAWSVATRKAIARKVSEEASAKYGVPVTIEDREMFMQTANEMGAQSSNNQTETPDNGQPIQDDEDSPD